MSEKTVVTIDSDISIPEGTEKVFENQHIRVGAEVAVNGTLILKDCVLEPYYGEDNEQSDDRSWYIWVQSTGKLEMEGCEIIRPCKSFLYGDNMTVKNTSILFTPQPDTVISLMGKNCRFEGCSFTGETRESGDESLVGLMSCHQANMENCTFQNINAVISIDTIIGCSFTDCGRVSGLQVTSSTFANCQSAYFVPTSIRGRGHIEDCDFIHVESVFCQKTDIENCRFQHLENKGNYKGIVYIDNCRAIRCTFDDIKLQSGSYLIYGDGNASVEACEFTNCITDREDSELCYIEPPKKIAKGLFKGALKLAGSATLAAVGVAATVVRQATIATGKEELAGLADIVGTVQDASFEKARSMLGMDGTRKIDNMNMDELTAYASRLADEMDDDERWDFCGVISDIINESETDQSEREAQMKELIKETVKARGQAKRAEDRAASASRNAESFNKRVEEERKKLEREQGK